MVCCDICMRALLRAFGPCSGRVHALSQSSCPCVHAMHLALSDVNVRVHTQHGAMLRTGADARARLHSARGWLRCMPLSAPRRRAPGEGEPATNMPTETCSRAGVPVACHVPGAVRHDGERLHPLAHTPWRAWASASGQQPVCVRVWHRGINGKVGACGVAAHVPCIAWTWCACVHP